MLCQNLPCFGIDRLMLTTSGRSVGFGLVVPCNVNNLHKLFTVCITIPGRESLFCYLQTTKGFSSNPPTGLKLCMAKIRLVNR